MQCLVPQAEMRCRLYFRTSTFLDFRLLLKQGERTNIATLVDRHTRYVMLAKVANKDTQTVVSALIKQAKKLPSELYKSLTWDRGKELADH
jgi:IS30 family transposase